MYLDNSMGYYVVSGGSMHPTFSSNDVVLWVDFPIENLRLGDIIVYRQPTLPDHPVIVHRVCDVAEPGRVRTKGDDQSEPGDYYVTGEYYEGLIIGTLFTSSTGWHA